MNRGWRFCRFSGVVNRVVSCWYLVCPAPPFYLVLAPYWTTFGLQLAAECSTRDLRLSGSQELPAIGEVERCTRLNATGDRDADRCELSPQSKVQFATDARLFKSFDLQGSEQFAWLKASPSMSANGVGFARAPCPPGSANGLE